jgi:hypothetical protein
MIRSRLPMGCDWPKRQELDAKRELIKAQPTLDAEQPHGRSAMKVFERLDRLYKESNEIRKIDPKTLLPYVTDCRH